MRKLIYAGIAGALLMIAGCTTHDDVMDARLDLQSSRQDLRDAEYYGSRREVQEARREERQARRHFKSVRRQYENENLCGPRHGLPCKSSHELDT